MFSIKGEIPSLSNTIGQESNWKAYYTWIKRFVPGLRNELESSVIGRLAG